VADSCGCLIIKSGVMYHTRIAQKLRQCGLVMLTRVFDENGTVIIRQTPPKLKWQICQDTGVIVTFLFRGQFARLAPGRTKMIFL